MVVGVIADSPIPIKSLGIARVIKFFAIPETAVKKLQTMTPIPIIFVRLYLSAKVPTNKPDTV